MTKYSGIWAVIPVKELRNAKQRLAAVLSPETRQRLVLAMLEDVLRAVTAAPTLAGVVVVTVDADATALAERFGARVITEGAQAGHTGAVTSAQQMLSAAGAQAMLTIPGDVPLVTTGEISALLQAAAEPRCFCIVPAHDERGSNAVLCSPPDLVSLRFGDDSFVPHLGAARDAGVCPKVLRFPGIALDIDNPADVQTFLETASQTATRELLSAEAGQART